MAHPDTPQGPVLVAGGAGYIGSHTVRALEERGVPVIVVDNLSTGFREAVGAPLAVVDLGDREALRAVLAEHKPRAVIHFAAKCYVGVSVTDPATYYHENVHKTWCLLEEMRAAGVKEIVFSSTCATYGEPKEVPIPDDHPQDPINPYGRTKLHMEHMMADYDRAYGLRYAALRYFNAAGSAPDGTIGEAHDPETHLIPLVLQVAQGKREKILMFGDDYPTPDGTCVRDYIHIKDLAQAHILALKPGIKGNFNLGNGDGYTVKEVIKVCREVTGHPIPAKVQPRRPGDCTALIADAAKAHSELGWAPQYADLKTIVQSAWDWHQAHPDGYSS